MAFLHSGTGGLELFVTRCRNAGLAAIPVYWTLMGFLIKEEGWHFSFLVTAVLPPVAAYLGVRGKREIRTWMSATALALVIGTAPLMLGLSVLETT